MCKNGFVSLWFNLKRLEKTSLSYINKDKKNISKETTGTRNCFVKMFTKKLTFLQISTVKKSVKPSYRWFHRHVPKTPQSG